MDASESNRRLVGDGNRSRWRRVLALAACLSIPVIVIESPLAAQLGCAGDCNGDGQVAVEELVRMSEIVLEHDSLFSCVMGDFDGTGSIAVNDLVYAINDSLVGCRSVFGSGQGTQPRAIAVSDTFVVPGGRAQVGVQLTGSGGVAALQHDLTFNAFTPVAQRSVGAILAAPLDFQDVEMFVGDTAGFPPFGVVRVGEELVAYRVVDRNPFVLAVVGRAARGTSSAFHPAGSAIAPASPVPDCTGEQGIGKNVVFSFLPSGCQPQIDCTGIRALAVDLDGTDDIGGPRIYSCTIDAAENAPLGVQPLTVSNAFGSDEQGNLFAIFAQDGSVTVGPIAEPTPTATTTPSPAPARIVFGTPSAGRGERTNLTAVLRAADGTVAAVRSVVSFDRETFIPANDDGLPDCTLGAEQDKTLTATFLPPQCSPAVDCSAVEVSVLSLGTIPDGSELYSCAIQIAADASIGSRTLRCFEPAAFGPGLDAVPAECVSGEVFVTLNPSETPTPNPGGPVRVEIGSATGGPGQLVSFEVILRAPNVQVAGVAHRISFDPSARIAGRQDGRPDCTVNPEIPKTLEARFVPSGCMVGSTCTGIQAIVLELSNVDPIPDGSVLYSCRVAIAADAFPGGRALACAEPQSSDPNGNTLATGCSDGEVLVTDSPPPRTSTPVVPTRTATPSARPTQTPNPNDVDGDGIPNAADNCLTFSNPDQHDADIDRVGDVCDNCPALPNPDQSDGDADLIGDACDTDRDNDFVPDEVDGCPEVYDPEQTDDDRDGVGDACDPCLSGTLLLAPRPVVLDGDPASGAEPGATLSSYASPEGEGPIIGPTGRVVFPAVVAAPDSTFSYSLWAGEKRDGLVEIVRAGEAAPGAGPGATFSRFELDLPAIDGRGRVAFHASVNAPDAFVDGIWVGRSKAELSKVALTGDRAPGMAEEERFASQFGLPSMNPAGTLAFYAGVIGLEGEGRSGIWIGEDARTLRAVVVTGDRVPGLGPSVTFVGFSQGQSLSPMINGDGAIAFLANIAGAGVDFTNDSGIWLGDAGALALIVRAGDPAPGFPGLAFDTFYTNGVLVDVNDAGQVAFLARVTSGDYGIWIAGADRTLRLLAATGQPAPGAGEDTLFTAIRDLRINARGTIVFSAELLGFFDESIWVGSSADDLRLVARADDRAPGTPNGAVFARFLAPSINRLGQVIFAAEVREPGFGFAGSALFAFDPIGGLSLIAGDGDLLEASSCAAGPLSGLVFQSGAGGEDGVPAGLNDRGEVVFLASLGPSAAPPPGGAGTDPDGPTGGVFSVTVPHRSRCPADCGDDGEVTLDELVVGAGIASGSQRIERCAAIDTNRDGLVGIDELVFAVAIAMNGCPPVLEAEFTASPCFTNSEGETQCFPIRGSALLIPSGPATPGEHRSTFVLADDDLPGDCRFVCTPPTSPRCGFRGDTTATISGTSLSQRTILARTLTAFCDGCRLEQDYRAVIETEAEVSGGTSRTELVGRVIASCQSTGDRCPFVEDFLDCESGVLRGTLNLRLVD